jgi:hypothetical protein
MNEAAIIVAVTTRFAKSKPTVAREPGHDDGWPVRR